ncbi:MAG: protein kinase [Firmicutes bacterium]|nr:protein kinase [Bacillota bacterium]
MTTISSYAPLWGNWHIDGFLGAGSFGRVYKVRAEAFGQTRYAAVKMLSIPQDEAQVRQMRGEGLDEASVRSYFQAFVADISREFELMREMSGHPNVVRYEEHKVLEKPEEFGWDILIRMELLTSLSARILQKPLSREEAVTLGIHLCRALEHCAEHKVIHRDIKPDNIFVDEQGNYKLGDFGVARQIERTMSGLSKKGTYDYMAPEVFKAETYGASCDVYSLGIVLYQLLNQGRRPFLPDYPAPILPKDKETALERRMKGEALPPLKDVPPALNDIIQRACAYDRRARFATASELRQALEAFADSGDWDRTIGTVGAFDALTEDQPQTGATIGAFDGADADRTEATVGAFDALQPPPIKKKKPSAIVIAVVCAGLLAGAGLGGWLFWQSKTDQTLREHYDYALSLNTPAAYEDCAAYVKSIEPELGKISANESQLQTIGDIYYLQANSYFMLEDYRRALPAYEAANANNPGNPEISRDYAICYARLGDIGRAEGYLKSRMDADPPSVALLKGEIAYAKGNYDEAAEQFNDVLAFPAANDYVKLRAVLISAQALRRLGDTSGEITLLLDNMATLPETYQPVLSERLADAYTQNKQYKEAAAIYEELRDGGDRRFATLQNIGVLWQNAKQYDQARAGFEALYEDFADRYEPPMRMAYLELDVQGAKSNAKRDYAQAKQWYDIAKRLYDARPAGSGDDPEMQRLSSLVADLEKNGWFDPDRIVIVTEVVTVKPSYQYSKRSQ